MLAIATLKQIVIFFYMSIFFGYPRYFFSRLYLDKTKALFSSCGSGSLWNCGTWTKTIVFLGAANYTAWTGRILTIPSRNQTRLAGNSPMKMEVLMRRSSIDEYGFSSKPCWTTGAYIHPPDPAAICFHQSRKSKGALQSVTPSSN